MSDARSRILLAMARLIEKQGYHATGLTEIIQESDTPKGSLYYYFPGGKEQIGAEAILESGKIISGRLRSALAGEEQPAEAVYNFLIRMAENVEASQFGAGSPLTTATIETAVTCEPINQACRDAFDMILVSFKDKFLAGGLTEIQAAELALYVTTVVEGGILMSRTYHHAEPLRLAARHLKRYLLLLAFPAM
ncbi:MAG TPA: TetR/AcrR family transcriptional regulator [Anaerolineales bacterium]|nr:TetR/AcrR family transcriptional regulator [Anaerolineales bacterium]